MTDKVYGITPNPNDEESEEWISVEIEDSGDIFDGEYEDVGFTPKIVKHEIPEGMTLTNTLEGRLTEKGKRFQSVWQELVSSVLAEEYSEREGVEFNQDLINDDAFIGTERDRKLKEMTESGEITEELADLLDGSFRRRPGYLTPQESGILYRFDDEFKTFIDSDPEKSEKEKERNIFDRAHSMGLIELRPHYKEDIFESPLSKAIKKYPSSQKHIPSDIIRGLRKRASRGEAPFREEEIRYTGLADFLENSNRVSKDDLLEYLRFNKIKVNEVVRPEEGSVIYPGYQAIRGGKDYTEITLNYAPVKMIEGKKKYYPYYEIFRKNHGEDEYRPVITLDSKWRAEDLAKRMSQNLENVDIIIKEKYEVDTMFDRGHYPEDNTIVHLRLSEFNEVDADNKILLVQEIQSDWYQLGAKYGYEGDPAPEINIVYNEKKTRDPYTAWIDNKLYGMGESFEEAKENAIAFLDRIRPPHGPFNDVKDWTALALRRAIKEAVNRNIDKIALTTGDQQLLMYSDFLARRADSIRYVKHQEDFTGPYGDIIEGQDFPMVDIELIKDGNVINTIKEIPVRGMTSQVLDGRTRDFTLDEIIGDTLSEKIRASEQKSGEFDIMEATPKGSGMRQYYDVIVPSVAGQLIKRYGVELGESTILSEENNKLRCNSPVESYSESVNVYSFPITDEMREDIGGKLSLY